MLQTRLERFALAYAGEAAGNGAKAATIAGYAQNSARVTACRLLKQANVQSLIANFRIEVERAAAQTLAATEQQAAAVHAGRIVDAAERRSILSGFLLNADADLNVRIKAAEVLNKMDGLYVQKVDVTHRTKPDLSKLSDTELIALEQMIAKATPAEIRH